MLYFLRGGNLCLTLIKYLEIKRLNMFPDTQIIIVPCFTWRFQKLRENEDCSSCVFDLEINAEDKSKDFLQTS